MATSESVIVPTLHHPYQPTQYTSAKFPGCGSAALRGDAYHTNRHVPTATRSDTLQKYVVIGKPVNKQETHSNISVQKLSVFSHNSSVNNNTCNYTRYMKQSQNQHL